MGAYAKTAPGERLTYPARPEPVRRGAVLPPHHAGGHRPGALLLRLSRRGVRRPYAPPVVPDVLRRPQARPGGRDAFPDGAMAAHRPDAAEEIHDAPSDDRQGPRAVGTVLFHINHGPGPVNTEHSVRSHLGTSVFADGSFDDKILDLVLEFHADDLPLPELDQWAQFRRTSTAGTHGPTARVRRRRFVTMLVAAVIGIITLPLMLFSCRGNNGNRGGGFGGGMLESEPPGRSRMRPRRSHPERDPGDRRTPGNRSGPDPWGRALVLSLVRSRAARRGGTR